MASSVGGIIEAEDFNAIRNKVIAILGTGTGNTGYGQDAGINSTSVAIGTTATALQWQNLRWDLYNVLLHQNGTAPTITTVSTGDTIRFGTAHPNNSYDVLANTATTNRFNIGAGQFATDNFGSKSQNFKWVSQAYLDITYTFSSSNAARFFFNSGGVLRIASSFTAGKDNSQNNKWNSLLASAGTQSFGGQTPVTGFSPMNGENFYRLTDTFQTYHTSTSDTYTTNTYRLQARSNVANNSSGTASVVYIRVLLTDAYVDPGNAPGDSPDTIDEVDGTVVVTSDMIRAIGTMQTPPGTTPFTIAGPTSNITSTSFTFT